MTQLPPTMTAAVFTAYGDIDNVVSVREDIPLPRNLGKNEVLIEVKAAAINPVDWKMIKGSIEMIMSSQWPKGVGFDFSGVIVDKHASCTRLNVGDHVWGMLHFTNTGSCAKYLKTNADVVGLKPKSIDFKEAASIPLVALTSWQALYSQAKIAQGNRVLVLGASGGTGAAAVQIAKAAGAYVAGTCSAKNVELVKQLGADEVIDYTAQNWWEVLSGAQYDIIYDTVGGYDTWTNSWRVLKSNGDFVTIAGDTQEDKLDVSGIFKTVGRVASRKFWSLISTPGYHNFTTSTNFGDLDKISKLVEEGKLKALIDSEYALKDTLAALQRNKTQRSVGKVVVNIDKIADDEVKQ